MKIGIDIDNTIINTHTYTKKYMNIYDPTIISNDYHELDEDHLKVFLDKYFINITEEVELLDDVIESFNKLKEMGYKIILVTARGSEGILDIDIESATLKRLEELNVPYDDISFNNLVKGKECHDLKIDLFIDDKESNLDDVSSYGIKCLRFLEDKEFDTKYPKFSNWKDIVNYIEMGEINGN